MSDREHSLESNPTRGSMRSSRPSRFGSRVLKWLALGLSATALILVVLFAHNGLSESWKVPSGGSLGAAQEIGAGQPIRALAWNLAKCNFHRGGIDFATPDEVREHLDRIAEVLISADADLVFLSEVVLEAGPCQVNQVLELAQRANYPLWLFAENYSFGVSFYRIRSGNAVLSRLPIRNAEASQLSGATPFYSPTGNRRILWFETQMAGNWIRAASLRNDSFDLANNELQVQEILIALDGQPALLAGDFNAEPNDPSMQLFASNGNFQGIGQQPTFPSTAPNRRIDFILAPSTWELVEERVLKQSGLSDHLPVLATYRLP